MLQRQAGDCSTANTQKGLEVNDTLPSLADTLHNAYVSAKDPYTPTRKSQEDRNVLFRILYGNITSFSDKIKSHLFSKDCRKKFSALCFVEAKNKNSEQKNISDLFAQHNLHTSVNPGENTRTGDGIHGGEIVAVNNNLNFKEIDIKTIYQI